jgi:hypothetical protein
MRLGVPGDINGEVGRGKLSLVSVDAFLNNSANTDTDTTVKFSTDPNETDEADEVNLGLTKAVADNAWTVVWDLTKAPVCVQGPVLVEVTSAGGTVASGGVVIVAYRSEER